MHQLPPPSNHRSHYLPMPNAREVEAFRALYQNEVGVELPYQEATAMLTHLVQFYFLTRGHELFDHNQRVRERQKQRRNPKQRPQSGPDSEPAHE